MSISTDFVPVMTVSYVWHDYLFEVRPGDDRAAGWLRRRAETPATRPFGTWNGKMLLVPAPYVDEVLASFVAAGGAVRAYVAGVFPGV